MNVFQSGAVATEADLIGTWEVMVRIDVSGPGSFAPLICTFSADHLVYAVNQPGYPTLEGHGIWTAQDDTFAFWITHNAHRDENGEGVGSIYAQHLGTVSDGEFATQGYTFITMHDGNPWAGPVSVTSTATRTG